MINTSRGRLMYPNVSCLSCVCRHRDGASIVCVYKCMSRLFKLTSVAISVNVLRPQKITQRNATQRKAKQSRAKQSKAKQSRAKQSNAWQSTATRNQKEIYSSGFALSSFYMHVVVHSSAGASLGNDKCVLMSGILG